MDTLLLLVLLGIIFSSVNGVSTAEPGNAVAEKRLGSLFLQDPPCTYKLFIKTADVDYGGTDANVGVTLFNNIGQKVEFLNLDNPDRDDFERGHTDDFTRENACIYVCGMSIYSDGSGKNSEWTVESVRVDYFYGSLFWPVNTCLEGNKLSFTNACSS